MYVTPARMAESTTSSSQTASTSSSNTASSSTDTTASSMQSMFLTLLTTELQTQDPTAPEDPTEMVTQLAQFDSLNELVSMNSSMGTLVTDAGILSGTQTTSTGGDNA